MPGQKRLTTFGDLDDETKKKFNFGRREILREIERKIQKKWDSERVYEEIAPVSNSSSSSQQSPSTTLADVEAKMRAEGKTPDARTIAFTLGYLAGTKHKNASTSTSSDREKYFCTFPYPYMNGRIHLGHAFTITKAEFASRFQRLLGKKVLFPFAFHCTGMPIQASANKLKDEIATFGIKNCMAGNFDKIVAIEEEVTTDTKEEKDNTDKIGVFKGKKTKLAAKTGKKTTWEILLACGVPAQDIPKFQDATHWLKHFPPLGKSDLKAFGLNTDWRRSFITTDVNPYYNSFIEWQFRKLKEIAKVKFGNRPTIFSPRDKQACADHDRSEGEGVTPQQYTLIKIQVLEPQKKLKLQCSCDVFMVAATLRPETMHGQTNCFVLPGGEYGAYNVVENDGKTKSIYICSEHSARNMAFQNFFPNKGKVEPLAKFTGRDLLGLALKAPNCKYDKVYSLPLLTIKMDKGTGIVTSVPSDAPDDYMALKDLQRDAKLREAYNITEDMVNFDVVPIISIPGGDPDLKIDDFKNMAAVTACETMKIRDQHDKGKLAKAKKRCYLKGFESGVMLVGKFKGVKVKDAKDQERELMISEGKAREYWEPENLVLSRTNDKCIVAYLDQWYLTYGEEEWRDAVMKHVKSDKSFSAYGCRKDYIDALNWMGKWACSRSFGLGTILPWDKKFVIESLSDSTIYMAYYTIAHLLQGENNMDGQKVGPSGIKSEQMNDMVWDYIFQGKAFPEKCGIEKSKLEEMRREFEFWYPMDLRVSGKDLIRNHLTMCLYNHAAIWADKALERWPKSFFTNGHVMVDAEKMSKSKGNFITLLNAIDSENMHWKLHKEDVKQGNIVSVQNKDGDFQAPSKDALIEESSVVKFQGADKVTYTGTIIKAPKKKSKKMSYTVKHDTKGEWTSQSWTVDTVRLALSSAGDGMEDANFESDVANNGILRLTKELEWFQTSLKGSSRTSIKTVDRVFLLKVKECMKLAKEAYETMKFRDAVKSGFYDLQNARDEYRNYHHISKEVMNLKCVETYIAAQAVAIAPVCPHWAEWIWTEILKKQGSVTNTKWLSLEYETNMFDARLELRRSDYITQAIQSFRGVLKPPKKKKKKKKADAVEEPKWVRPTAGRVYVRRDFEPWRLALIEEVKNLRGADGTINSKTAMKTFIQRINQVPALKALAPKLIKKNAARLIAKVNDGDLSYLDSKLPFDEVELLKENLEFITKSLELKKITIHLISDKSAPDCHAKELAAPEEPKMMGYVE